jgi:tRNA A37 threonylcarbamoyladenosine dehydratase
MSDHQQVSFLRAAGWVTPEDLAFPLIIIGCGAVGSNVALCAAKMGFTNFILWDKDEVEAHNLPNQTYEISHIGMPKVQALEEVLKRFNPEVRVESHNSFFTEAHASALQGFVVIATDNLSLIHI